MIRLLNTTLVFVFCCMPSASHAQESDCSLPFAEERQSLTTSKIIVHHADRTREFIRSNRGLETLRRFYTETNGGWFASEYFSNEFFKNKEILDIGAGDGAFVEDLRDLGVDAFGFDIFLNDAQQKSPFFKRGDAIRLPYEDASFDIVHSFQAVFYHSRFAEDSNNRSRWIQAMHEAKRVTKPNGLMILDLGGEDMADALSFIMGDPALSIVSPQRDLISDASSRIVLIIRVLR